MTKEKLLQTFRLFISKQTGRHIIRKVANRTDYTLFQIMRITPVLEHFGVVIGFKHKVISFVHTTNYPVGYSSAIGNYDKVLSPAETVYPEQSALSCGTLNAQTVKLPT